jgi:hypothetical protein
MYITYLIYYTLEFYRYSVKKPSQVMFVDQCTKAAYEQLRSGDESERLLYESLSRAFGVLSENAFAGIQVPKKQIPAAYVREFGVDNLWKLNLSGAWRLLYSVRGSSVVVLSVILEWLDHSEYDRRFGYK